MPSPIVTATIQATCLSALSNLLAQLLRSYRRGESFSLHIVPFLQFVLFTMATCPPNFLWQEYLEGRFPANTRKPDGQVGLDLMNTATKFTLDQTLGSVINTAIFIGAFSAFRGRGLRGIRRDVQNDTFPLMKNGWKLWPMVSILNFTIVPFHSRILVGSIVGLFWGIYLSLFAAGEEKENVGEKPLKTTKDAPPRKE